MCNYCETISKDNIELIKHSVMIVESGPYGGRRYPTKISVRLQSNNQLALHFSQSGTIDNYYFNVGKIEIKYCPMCGSELTK